MPRPVAGGSAAGGEVVTTAGDRLRGEIEALRAEARRRRVTTDSLLEAIDHLQTQIDTLFPAESASDESPRPPVKKKALKK